MNDAMYKQVPDYDYLKELLSSQVYPGTRVYDIDPPSMNKSVENDLENEQAKKKRKLSQLYESLIASNEGVQSLLPRKIVQTQMPDLFVNHFEADQRAKEATFLKECGVGMLHRPDRRKPSSASVRSMYQINIHCELRCSLVFCLTKTDFFSRCR